MNQDAPSPSSRGMEPTKLVITYGGKWVENFYEGGETELKKVNRNLTYAELSRLVQGVVNIDLTRFTIDLRTLVDTGVRLRPARPKIKDDSDVEMLLCDDGHVPEVYVSVVEKVSVEPGHGGRSGSMPPVIGGPNRDTCEDDAINVGDGSGTAVSQPWIIPGASNYSFEVVRTEESSSCNRLSKGGMFQTKKALKLALHNYALNENFETRVIRSSLCRYEVGCNDLECKFQFRVGKMEGGNYLIVQKFEEEHSCTIDDLHNRNRQASAWLIGEILAPKLAVSGRSLKPKEIMVDMQVEHGLGLLYSKALRAKQLAEENVFGPPDLSYQLLPAYCHQLKLVNPGTITAIKTNDGEKDGLVSLSEKTCSCREFQNDLLPCCHALAAIRYIFS
ncbi:hypothetical protein EZV62_019287 [Acer yangbiense]|uniref:SWIM-type domain-containing protein n=1 Tax=Acer yangbiense TaxID=1000413 RepID=A0A5C7HAS5_9ROSI|nr:hypothetical protein EZV62_019287 [Acer yangbiense]